MTTLDLDTINLPRLTVGRRLKEAAKLAWRTIRTGDHVVARAYSDGMRVGFAGADHAIRSVRESINANGGAR